MGDARGGPVVEGLSLVVLRVADVGTSAAFYEALGLSFVAEQHGNGPDHLSAEIGGTVLELYPMAGRSSEGVRLGFRVDDLTGIVETLSDAFVSDARRAGTRVVVLRDPDGHTIELTAPASS